MLHIYNTLTGRKEDFEPLDPERIKMYICGPTVYASAHVGHAMSYIVFDVVRRYLEYKGYKVFHVQNFTDVEDKIIDRARETGRRWDELSASYAEEFLQEMNDLNVQSAHAYPRASGVIPQIVEDIERLIRREKAYQAGGDVYFRVLSDPDYGKLSHRRLDEMRAGARVDPDERKEHPMDFALWKAAKPGEPRWDSPWGPGRPGWHIECTTMALRYLGEQVDIHGGGNDLIFPHHENEIAQSEQLTCKKPFALYWMHNGMVQLGDAKMAKSTGNVLSIGEIVEKYGADAYRTFVLSSHYRRPIAFSESAVVSAAKGVQRLALAAQHAAGAARPDAYAELRTEFKSAMDDDFNTPRAVAVLHELATEVNTLLSQGQDPSDAAALLRELAGVLGLTLLLQSPVSQDIAPFVQLLVDVRSQLRAARQWELSDRVRDGLRELGVALEDTAEGTRWRIEP